jgi:predicted ATPase with chaperone activity
MPPNTPLVLSMSRSIMLCDIARHTHISLLKHPQRLNLEVFAPHEIRAAMYPCPMRLPRRRGEELHLLGNVVARYQKRISGPLLDRIDIHVDVPRVNYEKLSGQRLGEPSHAVREFCRLDEAGQR